MIKQLIFAGGVALALAFAPVTAVAQQQQRTPERQALLDRLGAALPPSGATAQTAAARVRPSFAQIEGRMRATNAGREGEIAALLDSYALCIGTSMNEAAPGLVLDAADSVLNDAEIESLIAFYSSPDYTRFADINARMSRHEAVTDEELAFAQARTADPATLRFAMRTIELSRGFADTPAGEQIVTTCGTAFIAAYRSAGLRNF